MNRSRDVGSAADDGEPFGSQDPDPGRRKAGGREEQAGENRFPGSMAAADGGVDLAPGRRELPAPAPAGRQDREVLTGPREAEPQPDTGHGGGDEHEAAAVPDHDPVTRPDGESRDAQGEAMAEGPGVDRAVDRDADTDPAEGVVAGMAGVADSGHGGRRDGELDLGPEGAGRHRQRGLARTDIDGDGGAAGPHSPAGDDGLETARSNRRWWRRPICQGGELPGISDGQRGGPQSHDGQFLREVRPLFARHDQNLPLSVARNLLLSPIRSAADRNSTATLSHHPGP